MSTARDDRVVADIVENIPGVTDPAAVRTLLTAWWEHAARQASAGLVVDSGAFIAERHSAGLLELPADLAGRVIEREFALLHGDARTVPLTTATVAVPHGEGGAAARSPAVRARAAPPGRSPERLEAVVGAGLVVIGSTLVGLALLAGQRVDRLPLPGGGDDALVTPWKAWLAVLGGAFGVTLALVGGARRSGGAHAVRLPGVALGGLAVAGVGLLGGSLLVTVLGGGVFGLVGAAAVLARREAPPRAS